MVRDVILLVSHVVQFYYYFFHIHLNDVNTFLEALCRVLCYIYMHTLWIFVNTVLNKKKSRAKYSTIDALCCAQEKVQLSYSLAQPMNK